MPPAPQLNDETSGTIPDQTGQALPAVSTGKDRALSRILIVDDETTITWLLKEGLAEMADEVASATNGQEALQLFTATSFDVLITDYKMSDMDGLILAGHVKRLQPQARIVMLTAYGSDWLSQRAAEVGIEYVLNKPVRLAEIRRLVSELLQQ